MLVFRPVNNRNPSEWFAHLSNGFHNPKFRKALKERPTIVHRDIRNPRRFHLKSLFAYPEHGWNGTRVLRALFAFVAESCPRRMEKNNRCEILLQDQSYRMCANDSSQAFSLGFRSMIDNGQTWYERNGFEMIERRGFPSRDEIAQALKDFRNMRSEDVIRSLRQSAERTRSPRCCEMRRDAIRILSAWSAGKKSSRLGTCLLVMPCEDYVTFMRNTYPIVSPNLIPSSKLRKTVSKCKTEEHIHGWDVFDKASIIQSMPYRVTFRAVIS